MRCNHRRGLLSTLVLALCLSACSLSQSISFAVPTITPAPTTVPTPPPTNTSLPVSTPTRAATPAPTPISFPADTCKRWLRYANSEYGFALRYPSDWTSREVQGTVSTMSGHAVYLEPRATNLARLVVGFKAANEAIQITRTGIGSGDIVQRGSILFLGQAIRRDVLVLQGQDLAILYQGSSQVSRGHLVFTLSFDYRGNPVDKSALTPEIVTIADKIVSSFELVR